MNQLGPRIHSVLHETLQSLWAKDAGVGGKGIFNSRFFALLLVVFNLAVYYPALHTKFDTDQVVYFAELKGSTGMMDGLAHCDYSLTRKLQKGDNALFRPLLFVWLALANHFFSYHVFYWNLSNVCFHIAVVLLLFRLLFLIQPSLF